MTALFSLQNDSRLQASISLSTHSFYESILFVHLKTLRGGELRLVRTVGMVRLEAASSLATPLLPTCIHQRKPDLVPKKPEKAG